MVCQAELVNLIYEVYEGTQRSLAALRDNWRMWDIFEIQDIVDTLPRAINFVRTGLVNPTDANEHTMIERWAETMEDHYIEAEAILYAATRDKATQHSADETAGAEDQGRENP